MRCSHPFKKNVNGVVLELPCGQCMACRLNYGKDWSVRIMDETKSHDESIFLTLTYDDEHLPSDCSLHKEDVQKFFKRLRNYVPNKIRYFIAGEYGDKFGRPHYHAIIFGLGVTSDVFQVEYDSKHKGYFGTCSAWPFGQVFIGNVTPDSAGYVAKYNLKKQKGKKANEFYRKRGINPEFATMSRNPGIGFATMQRFSDEYRRFGSVVSKGKEYGLPRYYQEKLGYDPSTDKWSDFLDDRREFRRSGCRNWQDFVYQRGNQQEANLRSRFDVKY